MRKRLIMGAAGAAFAVLAASVATAQAGPGRRPGPPGPKPGRSEGQTQRPPKKSGSADEKAPPKDDCTCGKKGAESTDGRRPPPRLSRSGESCRRPKPPAEGGVESGASSSDGGKGNNGVGNGEDPQPPGDPPSNDGPGTGPGDPGNRGRGRNR